MNSMRTVVIVVLIVAVALIGYLYYQRTRGDVTIQLPKIQVNP